MEQIDGCIKYQERMLEAARVLGAVSQEALIQQTIKLLKELRELKVKEC